MIKVYISGNRAEVIEREPLTSGTVGKVISFTFTEDWRLLIKYAVFEGSGRRIALTNISDSCIIPHEVLAKHGGALRVGVYGRTADGSAATPTVYAQLGIIQRGADPNADPSTKPTLPVWAQIQAKIGDLSNLTTEDKTNLVAAINEAAMSGGGSGGGKDGTGIASITYKGEDEDGGNVYTVLLTDGTSYEITAPKGSTGAKGDKGDTGSPGSDGTTPYIGDNGNWFIGSTDTGKPSRGGASDAQVSTAVSTWLIEHPEATTTVQDGTITDAKLSDDLYKRVMGGERHKLTEEEVTPIPQNQVGADWVAANFDGSAHNVVTTFFTPFAKTPRYIKVVNKTSATTIKLRSGNTKYRFANGADESAEGFAIGSAARNLQFFNDIQIAAGETLLYDLQEFGRKGCEYFQFIVTGKNIGGKYTDAQFTEKLRESVEVYYVYDSYVPTYNLPDDSGELLIDLPVRYVAQGINNTSTTIGFAVVPYYPDTTYNVRGGVYNTILVNALSVFYLLDDAIFNGRDKGIAFNSGDCGHIPLIIGSSTTQYDTSVNGGADSKYQWAYVKTPPASELVGPKYVAIPMVTVSQDDATDKGEEYYKAIFDALNEKGPQNTYVTRFSKQVPRSLYAQLAFPNPNYHDDGSKYYAMLTSASKSPLVGASWVLFGDSLTDNYGGHDLTGNYFATKIAREFNMSFDNRAKSGSNIYRGGSGNYTSVSGMIKLDEFVAEIEAGTTEQPDYITIAFGTNSFTAQLGTNEDTAETDTSVYGATKRFIEVLREKCPKSVFGFVLSPKQNWGSSDPNNLRAVDAARTAIKTVCEEYGVPYIDMSTQSSITAAMLPDGIHISNDQSQNLYYHAMRRFMIGL